MRSKRRPRSATTPARSERIGKLASEFNNYASTFAEILKAKQDSAQIVQNQLTRGGMSLRYKLDDLTSLAVDAEQPAIEFGFKQVSAQHQAATALVNTFVVNGDPAVASSAQARLKFVENSLQAIIATEYEKIQQGLTEASKMLEDYRTALLKLIENGKLVVDLQTKMSGAADAIMQGSRAMKDDLLADQQRYEAESNATVTEIENMILMLAIGGFLLGATLALLLGRGISRPMIAMCKAMRELAGGNFDVVLPGLGRKDEIGEMAAAVEEFKLQAVAKAERDAADPGSTEQGRRRGAPRGIDPLRRPVRIGGRLHRRQCLGIRRAAGIRGGNADPHRRDHAESLQPGRRRLRTSVKRHAVRGGRNRGALGFRQRDRAPGARVRTRLPMPR